MKTTTMNTILFNNLINTAEEIGTVKREGTARIHSIFTDDKEKNPFALDLSPAKKARLFL